MEIPRQYSLCRDCKHYVHLHGNESFRQYCEFDDDERLSRYYYSDNATIPQECKYRLEQITKFEQERMDTEAEGSQKWQECEDCGGWRFCNIDWGDGKELCDSCEEYYTYCSVCEERKHEDSECEHIFWNNEWGCMDGCGADEGDWRHKADDLKKLLRESPLENRERIINEIKTRTESYLEVNYFLPECNYCNFDDRNQYRHLMSWLNTMNKNETPKAYEQVIKTIEEFEREVKNEQRES